MTSHKMLPFFILLIIAGAFVPTPARTSRRKAAEGAVMQANSSGPSSAAAGSQEIFTYKPETSLKATNVTAATPTTELSSNFHPDLEEEVNNTQLIRPNFENAELGNFVNYVGQLVKINVIPTKETANARVSLNMRSDLTKREVWEVFHTVLETAGFTINKSGNVYKVVKQDTKKTEPLPAYINVSAKDLPDSEASIRFVVFLQNIQASDVEGLLKGMLGNGGDLIRQDNVNGFIITDKCNNIKSAMTIINELDNTGLQETVSVIPLKKSDAQDVKKLLDDLTKSSSDKTNNIVARILGRAQDNAEYFSVAVKIIAEERSNSLILLGNQKSIKKIEDFISQYIEREEAEVESPIHRYQLEYSDASAIKGLLEEIVNSQTESGAEKFGGIRRGGKYFKPMRFEVDKDSNSLLVSAQSKDDWKLLKKTIRDLDKAQPQVAIETLIVDINMDEEKALGAQIRSPRGDQPFTNFTWQSATLGGVVTGGANNAKNLLGNLGSALGNIAQGYTVFALSRGAADVWAVFTALQTQTNASVVDNSFITIANRVAGKFAVGETRRVQTQAFSGYTGTGAGYDDRDAKNNFNITPQINPDGLINLDIDISMDAFVGDSANTTNKQLKTVLSVANGQVIILGGFVKTKATEDESRAPILSRVPILGNLFKSKNRKVTKTYTFIFMCPTIIKPRQHPGVDLYTKMKIQRARKEVEQSIITGVVKDPIHNYFFNPSGDTYGHKITDFENARYQPTTVDIKYDPYYQPGLTDVRPKDFQDEFADDPLAQKLRYLAQDLEQNTSKDPSTQKTSLIRQPVVKISAAPKIVEQLPQPEVKQVVSEKFLDKVDRLAKTALSQQSPEEETQIQPQPEEHKTAKTESTPPVKSLPVEESKPVLMPSSEKPIIISESSSSSDWDDDFAETDESFNVQPIRPKTTRREQFLQAIDQEPVLFTQNALDKKRAALKQLLAPGESPERVSKRNRLKQMISAQPENPYAFDDKDIEHLIQDQHQKQAQFKAAFKNELRSPAQKTSPMENDRTSRREMLKKSLFASPDQISLQP